MFDFDVIKVLTVLAVALSAVIEVSPIKINPWSKIAQIVGRAINGEMMQEIQQLNDRVNKLTESCEEREAKNARIRILRFGDEVYWGREHSKENFDQTLRDVSDYEAYCASHPEFKNNTTVLTTEMIKEKYKQCLDKKGFL